MTELPDAEPMTRRSTLRRDDAEPLEVVGAVIARDAMILAALRGRGKALADLWEFPGGKVELGESHEDALIREIREELDCAVAIGERIVTADHYYEFGHIRLTTYHATIHSGIPRTIEHSRLRWIAAPDLRLLQWAPADIPTVEALLQQHARGMS